MCNISSCENDSFNQWNNVHNLTINILYLYTMLNAQNMCLYRLK